jgi:hypothetical protein
VIVGTGESIGVTVVVATCSISPQAEINQIIDNRIITLPKEASEEFMPAKLYSPPDSFPDGIRDISTIDMVILPR